MRLYGSVVPLIVECSTGIASLKFVISITSQAYRGIWNLPFDKYSTLVIPLSKFVRPLVANE